MSGAGGGESFNPPLRVLRFIATRPGDPDRGPMVRLSGQEAALRILVDGELAWVHGPRRSELATVRIDDTLPRGEVVLRDVAGVAPSEIIRVVKPDFDSATRRRFFG